MTTSSFVSSGYARHFIACNRHDLTRFTPLFIAEKRYGHVRNELAALLLKETDLFARAANAIALAERFTDFASRSAALRQATDQLCVHYQKPLRNELYPVIENWGNVPAAQIDRAAVNWFGFRAWGIHVNGFVRKPDGIHLWIGERAADRLVDPGKLDNLIGGGQPIGLTLEQNLCKEAYEEAGIDAALALTARPVREISYRLERPEGLRDDTLCIYDLELPENVTPRNTDGEVAAFHLLSLPDVAALVRDSDRFKFNCNLVVIDFLIRHGFLTPQDPDYDALQSFLGPQP